MSYQRISSIGWVINVTGWLIFGLSYIFYDGGPAPNNSLRLGFFYGGIALIVVGFMVGMIYGRKHRRQQLIEQHMRALEAGQIQRPEEPIVHAAVPSESQFLDATAWAKREPVYGQPATASTYLMHFTSTAPGANAHVATVMPQYAGHPVFVVPNPPYGSVTTTSATDTAPSAPSQSPRSPAPAPAPAELPVATRDGYTSLQEDA